MMGRWTASGELLSENQRTKKIWQLLLPFAAFAVVYAVNYLKAKNNPDIILNNLFLPYLIFVLSMAIISFLSIDNSAKMLLIFSSSAVICMIAGLLTTGKISILFFLSGGLWCSVLWPCIFAQAIKNLGIYTSQGSAFLIMMILGGAIIPPFQGWLADQTNIKFSYIITPLCFLYLAGYGWWAMRNNKDRDVV
jgi:FHS family L-fucose permease-like MFS transporter